VHALIRTNADGSVAIELDLDAARAVFASILFAARFHERIAPLVIVAKQGLDLDGRKATRRQEPCR
jgi:hypothetical protein